MTFVKSSSTNSLTFDVSSPLMNRYSVRIEQAQLSDNWYMLENTATSYYNLIEQPSFPYYWNPNMWNGLLIDMNEESITYVRQVVTLSDWAG
jgi:hypothetical protein